MPLGFSDGLMVIRDRSKGNVTANENASTNAIRVAPGLYDISISIPQQGQGTTAISTLTAGTLPTGGTFTLTVGGQTTTALTAGTTTASAAAIQAAILALTNVVLNGITYPVLLPGDFVVTGGPYFTGGGTVTITAGGRLQYQPITFTANLAGLTGGATLAINSAGAGGSTLGVLPALVAEPQESSDGASFASLNDQRLWTAPQYNPVTGSQEYFIRSVRVTKNGNPNLGVRLAPTNQTGTGFGGVEIVAHRVWDTMGWQSQP